MTLHVAILKTPYLKLILSGHKTIESRLTLTRQPPFGRVNRGDRLFFKHSGGPFAATALAHHVESYADVTAQRVRQFQAQHNDRICGSPAYWESKQNSRYATFIHLCDVERIDVGPDYHHAPMRAWLTLDPAATVLVEVVLTDAAIRNSLVRLGKGYHHFAPGDITLLMPDGQTVETQINDRRHIGGRTWHKLYHAYHITPGDAVRFVALGDRRYRVSFVKHHDLTD